MVNTTYLCLEPTIRTIRGLIEYINAKFPHDTSIPQLFQYSVDLTDPKEFYFNFMKVKASFDAELCNGSIKEVENAWDKYFILKDFPDYEIRYVHVDDDASGWYCYIFNILRV